MPEHPVNRTLLIVDDSPVDRLLVRRLLEKHPGWTIREAANGREAFGMIAEISPDLVVTDMNMPEMNGLQLVSEVKRLYRNLPIILITGAGSEAAAVESLRNGATSYTPKTALQTDLVRTAQYVLELAEHISTCPLTSQANFQQRFVLSNDCHLVMPFIEHLQNHMPGWTDDCRLQLGMAIGEAMVNAMHHGNLEVCSSLRTDDETDYHETIRSRREQKPFCDRRVSVQADFSQQQLSIRVCDEGVGFNPDAVPDPRESDNLMKLSGRGLLLIRSFMDRVNFNDRGNEITMIKNRPS